MFRIKISKVKARMGFRNVKRAGLQGKIQPITHSLYPIWGIIWKEISNIHREQCYDAIYLSCSNNLKILSKTSGTYNPLLKWYFQGVKLIKQNEELQCENGNSAKEEIQSKVL